MAKSIYEKKNIDLRVKVTRNPKRVRQVTFTPVFDPVHGELKAKGVKASYTSKTGKATATFEAPTVPDDLEFYKLQFTAEVKSTDTKTQDVDGSYKVYPKTGEVVLTSANGEDHKKARIVIKGKKPSTKTAKSTGVWTGTVPLGSWTVEANPPYELVAPQPQTLRKREYQIKKNTYPAKFASPALGDGDEIKQYVNLEPAEQWAPEASNGSELEFTVTGENSLAQPGDIVYVKVVFSNLTKRSHPKRELKTTNMGSPKTSNGGKTFKGKVKLDSDGKGKFKVVFGYAGGEKCTIGIGTTSSANDVTVNFETWRKLMYELMYPSFMEGDMDTHSLGFDIHAGIKSVADARLAPVFIEYQLDKLHRFTKKEAGKCAFAPEKCGMTTRTRMVFGGGLTSFPKSFEGGNKRRVGILMAEFTAGDPEKSWKPLKNKLTTATALVSTGKKVMLTFKVKPRSGKWKAVVPNKSNYEGPSGVFTHPGLETDGTLKEGTLPDSAFTWEDYKHVKVTLPSGKSTDPGSFVGALDADHCEIEVKFGVKVAGTVNGRKASEGRQIMCIKPGKNQAAIASTLCHELGHSMGMTIVKGRSKEPPGLPKAKHVDDGPGLYYSEQLEVGQGLRALGQGPHCAHGVPNKLLPDFGKKRGSCIMFHSGGAADDRKSFCPTCVDYIRARKLVDLHDSWDSRGKNEY